MQIVATIDQQWLLHQSWKGLSYRHLTVLFIAFALRQHVIQATTGWVLGPKQGTDDRLGAAEVARW